MKIHNIPQGSPEWHAHRDSGRYFNASDAPAMLNCSPNESRSDLLKRLYLSMRKDVSDFVRERVLDPGHRFEALARPLAEAIIGEELYPVTGSTEAPLYPTMGRDLSASFDGITLNQRLDWEHKRLNNELRAAFTRIDAGESPREALPRHHRVQMEHQMLVNDSCERTLFMASEWTDDGTLIEERHCWYESDPDLRECVLAGWAQFGRDLSEYELPEAAPAAPVGRAPETLPALRIELTGKVTASNLAEFKATALGAIRSVNRDLRTDGDFADAEKATKWCAEVESRLKAAKEHALSQTASIDALFKALDDIAGEARTVRLGLEKLVARRKQEVKEQAVAAARRALEAHVAALNAELAPYRMPAQDVDFAGSIKGLRSVASMQDALDSALAAGKIAADAIARGIRANVAAHSKLTEGLDALFPDLPWLVLKAPDDFVATLQARIAQHKAAEERQAREKAEAEEAARIAARAESDRLEALALATSVRIQGNAAAAPPASLQSAMGASLTTDQGAQAPQAVTPGATAEGLVSPTSAAPGTPAPTIEEGPPIKLGALCERFGFVMSESFIRDVLKVPVRRDGRAVLIDARHIAALKAALISHVERA